MKAKSFVKEAKVIMTENNNLVTSTQSIIKALHKLGFDDGMYDLIKNH